jgi:hypothetical protein
MYKEAPHTTQLFSRIFSSLTYYHTLPTHLLNPSSHPKMFSKVAILAIVSLALSAVAAPQSDEYNCNTGPVQCCNEVHKSDSAAGATLLRSVGIVAQGISGSIGGNCSPLTGAGLGNGASWLVHLPSDFSARS